MYLFLEGAPHVGKSTILRNALLPHQAFVAGFMVQRLFRNEAFYGFRACTVDGGPLPALEAPYTNGLEGIFLYAGKTVPGVLEDTISRAEALCARDFCKLIVLDEIGGFELTSPAFMRALDAILRLGKPCLGVIKSRENLAQTANRLNLSDSILRQNDDLHRRIEKNGRVLAVTDANLAIAAQAASHFVHAVMDG